MSGHTPGPWEVPHLADNSIKCDCAYVVAEHQHGMGAICEIRHGGEDEPLEVAKANARLIAAAPELLDACKTALAFVAAWSGYYQSLHGLDTTHPAHDEDLKKVQAAIAKATGEQA